jgi:hypothetical protein
MKGIYQYACQNHIWLDKPLKTIVYHFVKLLFVRGFLVISPTIYGDLTGCRLGMLSVVFSCRKALIFQEIILSTEDKSSTPTPG